MTASVWDDPDLKVNDDYVKLENVGDTISGVITNIQSRRFDDGSMAPQITFIDDRDQMERTWTAGQVQAKRQLAELRPEIGWHFRATLVSVEKRGGGKTLKHIPIEATPGPLPGQATAPTKSAAPAGDPPCPHGVDPAAWQAMTPAQRMQMATALGGVATAARRGFDDEPPF